MHKFCVDIAETLLETFKQRLRFTTSPEVVMKASRLPFAAICAIASEEGVEIKDTRSKCIDENLLSKLADAHIRQIKYYFFNASHHISELSGAELSAFVKFCQTFKKHQTDNCKAVSWNDIDIEAIGQHFLDKVHSLTSDFQNSISFLLEVTEQSKIDLSSKDVKSEPFYKLSISKKAKDIAIERIFLSKWMFYIHHTTSYESPTPHNRILRLIMLFARFHTLIDEDSNSKSNMGYKNNSCLPYVCASRMAR